MGNFRSSPSSQSGRMNASGSIRGHELFLIHGACNFNTAAERFLPMGYNDTETNAGGYQNRFIAPARGRWVKSYVKSSVASDTTTLKLYKAVNTEGNTATLIETVSVECGAAATTYEFSSADAARTIHFNEGDAIGFRFDPETQPDLTNFTHVLELYTRADIA